MSGQRTFWFPVTDFPSPPSFLLITPFVKEKKKNSINPRVLLIAFALAVSVPVSEAQFRLLKPHAVNKQ